MFRKGSRKDGAWPRVEWADGPYAGARGGNAPVAAYKLLTPYDNGQAEQMAAVAGGEGSAAWGWGDATKLIGAALRYLLGSEQGFGAVGRVAQRGCGSRPTVGWCQGVLRAVTCAWVSAVL